MHQKEGSSRFKQRHKNKETSFIRLYIVDSDSRRYCVSLKPQPQSSWNRVFSGLRRRGPYPQEMSPLSVILNGASREGSNDIYSNVKKSVSARGTVQGNSHLKAAMRTLPSTVHPLGGGNDSASAGFAQPAGGTKKKSPLGRLFDQGGVNPAATYSPGSEDQVPSAIWGLTSVFGMGTGVTPTR